MKPFPLALAALLLAALVWRRARVSRERQILGALAVVALAVYGSGAIHPPNLETVVRNVGETLGQWTYLLVGVMAFLETGAFVGLVAPGEITILVGGVVAGQGVINVVVLIGIVWAAAVAGDCTSFLLGRRLGRGFMVRHGPRVGITDARLTQVEAFFERHGGKTILIGRFIGLVRAIAPFIAGASRMRFRRFIPFDIVGAGLWGSGLVVLGYVFWQSFNRAAEIAKRGAFALGVVISVVVGIVVAVRWLRVPENRSRAEKWLHAQAERPAVRPFVRVLRPVWRRTLAPLVESVVRTLRFVWNRITPGELGLELTTLLAVALVGAFAFGGLASLIVQDHQITFDMRAFDIAGRLRTQLLTDLAKVVTALGSMAVVGPVVLVAAGYLLMRRRGLESAMLVLATVLTFTAVQIAKASVDRARPSGALIDVEGSSYPSGHAAQAITLVGVAAAMGYVLPGFVHRATVVVITVILAAAVGLSRVYLRVHYFSDVLGGWGLGAAIFATCGMVALVVGFLRENRAPAG